jgi:GntR family transcriptional regulator
MPASTGGSTNMKIIIANSSPDPIYEQITKQIKTQIISGELGEGEALPSIRKLAKELHISVITTKRAYENLESEGYIDTVAGKGCFVAGQNKEFLREKRMSIVEDKLSEAIDEARMLGLDIGELKEMLELLYGEEDSLKGSEIATLTKIEIE